MTVSRIMIVEDEAITAMELEETLKKRGYDVIGTASNGNTAIRIAKEKWPDLILMDIRIEGKLDGIETANQIHGFHEIPIIFLTAYSDDLTISRAIKTKSHSFMLKPFNEKELYSNIELALRRHRDYQKSIAFERVMGTMFDLISDGIITTDQAGTVRRVTSNAEKMIGHTQDEIAGKPIFDVIAFLPGQQGLFADMIKAAGTGGEALPVKPQKLVIKSPSSDEGINIRVKIEPVRLEGGEITELIVILSPAR
jgi:PAS domain S-box-containing protein